MLIRIASGNFKEANDIREYDEEESNNNKKDR